MRLCDMCGREEKVDGSDGFKDLTPFNRTYELCKQCRGEVDRIISKKMSEIRKQVFPSTE